jgi:hypothetical protein
VTRDKPEPNFQALYGKVLQELRALRKKQYGLRRELRLQTRRNTDLRQTATTALEHLDAGRPDEAATELRQVVRRGVPTDP